MTGGVQPGKEMHSKMENWMKTRKKPK